MVILTHDINNPEVINDASGGDAINTDRSWWSLIILFEPLWDFSRSSDFHRVQTTVDFIVSQRPGMLRFIVAQLPEVAALTWRRSGAGVKFNHALCRLRANLRIPGRLADSAACPHLSFICRTVFPRTDPYLWEQRAHGQRDSTPATPPTRRETWLAWPKWRSKVSCCWRPSTRAPGSAAARRFARRIRFTPLASRVGSDKCKLNWAPIRRGDQNTRRRSVAWAATKAPKWWCLESTRRSFLEPEWGGMWQLYPPRPFPLQIQDKHVKYVHISNGSGLHLHGFA